jgi:hypothetical protein
MRSGRGAWALSMRKVRQSFAVFQHALTQARGKHAREALTGDKTRAPSGPISTLISPLPERGPSDITSPNERFLAPIGTTSPRDTLPVPLFVTSVSVNARAASHPQHRSECAT